MSVTRPRPIPEGNQRREDAKRRRTTALNISQDYPNPNSTTNGDEDRLEDDGYAASFTKGLPHGDNGILNENAHYSTLVEAINQDAPTNFEQTQRGIAAGRPAKTTFSGDALDMSGDAPEWRGWESPRAGHYYSIEGPDSDAVSMPPAPALGSVELDAEMAEVYALALLRDTTFADIADSNNAVTPSGIKVKDVIDAVTSLDWYSDQTAGQLNLQERRRRAARFESHGEHNINVPPNNNTLARKDIFRGSSPGVKDGPYVSQFMLQGTRMQQSASDPALFDGASLTYGSQEIDQKVSYFPTAVDYMLHWNAYLDVQNGADFGAANRRSPMPRRFIDTPRDLATYVRFDQLYQAYLNACLFMLDAGPFRTQQPVKGASVSFGPGFPDRSAQDSRQAFATFGGPHILSLVTEIATRCLKAVRRQKFNYHRRGRPERIGALLTLAAGAVPPTPADQKLSNDAQTALGDMQTRLESILSLVNTHNKSRRTDTTPRADRPSRADNASSSTRSHADPHLTNDSGELDPPGWQDDKNFLLAMAFAEGSPMHPSYGAGHATVAGGCVTMLKAFFDTVDDRGNPVPWPSELPVVKVQEGSEGQQLRDIKSEFAANPITISGELNKLAANISIGRDMAGVHFYTDYYESVRMGERVATGTLREQLALIDEPVEMNFHSFDGDLVHLQKTGGGSEVSVSITDSQGAQITFEEWWTRHLTGSEAPLGSDTRESTSVPA